MECLPFSDFSVDGGDASVGSFKYFVQYFCILHFYPHPKFLKRLKKKDGVGIGGKANKAETQNVQTQK